MISNRAKHHIFLPKFDLHDLKPIISEKTATQSKISKNRITLIPYRFLYFLRHLVVKDVISNTFQKSLQHILKKDPLGNLQYVL